MPAPTQALIYQNLKAALLSKIDPTTGHPMYCFKAVTNGTVVYTPTELMPSMDDIIQSLATAINLTWATWQAAQSVVATDTVTGAPVIGTGPIALP